MRNVLTIPSQGTDILIIASDNSGGVGMKEDDLVSVPYETVAYFSFRVAVMECMAAGGEPVAVILNNFCGNEAWEKLTRGIHKGLDELALKNVRITGSTESNFSMKQSAIGIIVLGRKPPGKKDGIIFKDQSKIAIIGKPLVGNEVMEQEEHIAPLPLFQKISRFEGIKVWPIGSKGILSELNQLLKSNFSRDHLSTDVDVLKSSGPATCFMAVYQQNAEEVLKNLAGSYFHGVTIVNGKR